MENENSSKAAGARKLAYVVAIAFAGMAAAHGTTRAIVGGSTAQAAQTSCSGEGR